MLNKSLEECRKEYIFQGYRSDTHEETVFQMFVLRYGYPPRWMYRLGTVVYAGPVLRSKEEIAQWLEGSEDIVETIRGEYQRGEILSHRREYVDEMMRTHWKSDQ